MLWRQEVGKLSQSRTDSRIRTFWQEYHTFTPQFKSMIASTHHRRRFRCLYCGCLFLRQSSVSKHVKNAHQNPPLPFPCDHCSCTFSTLNGKNVHTRNHHFDRKARPPHGSPPTSPLTSKASEASSGSDYVPSDCEVSPPASPPASPPCCFVCAEPTTSDDVMCDGCFELIDNIPASPPLCFICNTRTASAPKSVCDACREFDLLRDDLYWLLTQ